MRQSNLPSPFGRGSVWDFMSEMEKAFGDILTDNQSLRSSSPTRMMGSFTPAVELHENNDGYLLSFDLPGIPEKDVKIEVQDGRLTVSGERRSEQEEKRDGGFRSEKFYGRFERSFALPTQIDEKQIQARYENGVLEILVPKGEQAKPRQVSISSKGGLFSRMLGKGEPAAVTEEKH